MRIAPSSSAMDSQSRQPLIISASPQMAEILALVGRVAAGDAKVLITGESGVGKDLIAREIHARSVRASRPCIAVNCAGLTETLLESELFGHVKGSFTGAYRDKPGKLQLANRGTLFLDEVGEMSLRMQALLLRFLENGEIQAVGADHALTTVDVRVIAATNRNLAEMVSSGQFREDLLYRLRVIHIHVPPLRERKEDVSVLVQHMVTKANRTATFSAEAVRMLERYRWPGNVRELHNVVEQALWMSNGENVLRSTCRRRFRCPPTPRYRAATAAARWPTICIRRSCRADIRSGSMCIRCSWRATSHATTCESSCGAGLTTTRGNYRALLRLFGMGSQDYKRFLNFLAAHECNVDFREFRHGTPVPQRAPRLLPPLTDVPPAPIDPANDPDRRPF